MHEEETSDDIKARIRAWGKESGFDAVRFARAEVGAEARQGLLDWLADGAHGAMDYMARHAELRLAPERLHPGTRTIISVRLNYLTSGFPAEQALADHNLAYVSRYALGRDYHKTLRNRLQGLAQRIADALGRPAIGRPFVDSAPVMEVEFARASGLGWRGKHTLLLTRAGSWHFLGEILTDLELEPDPPVSDHCGSCRACMDICPTAAIVAPYRVDARRCISYLTIEHPGAIAEELRPLIGNRIYGCDDCQLACPWNRFAELGCEADFAARHRLDEATLAELFAWTAEDFASRLAGSPIRRIGYERWMRNLAIGLGNGPATAINREALLRRQGDPSPLVREHVGWALARLARTNDQATGSA